MAAKTWRIANKTVTQEADGRVHWISGAAIDVDGANGQNGNPWAYRLDNKGLDLLANAGWPKQSWRNVLIDDGTGHPQTDEKGNCYSSTTYRWRNRPLATRYVDATAVAYIVVNPIVRVGAKGIVIGCKGQITWRGISIPAVVADVSGRATLGEASMAAVEQLLRASKAYSETAIKRLISPRTGGLASGVLFEFWPGQPARINGEIYELQAA